MAFHTLSVAILIFLQVIMELSCVHVKGNSLESKQLFSGNPVPASVFPVNGLIVV